ncbi:hypothetical protein HNQ77_002234 [Silvibacterium bohemicum]|uniref:Potassium channel domain-containing protein n=1 Tax=Silvibacterium bohemicum TaxID=1577686 RepID=A0A841JSA8_9BACT|nr:potassium channel family protein [Silvibacterium bohemicum]MBB6144282.1 hypothetical protein [Silvibacterium bohemicum]
MTRLTRSPIPKLLLFLALTFVMAGVYELIWLNRPDYFRLQSGVNVLPLDLERIALAYSTYSDKKPLPGLTLTRDQQDSAEKIDKVYQEFQALSVKLKGDEADLSKRETSLKTNYTSFERAQWQQYELFVSDRQAPAKAKSDAIRQQMNAILAASNAKTEDDLPSGPAAVAHANLGVQLAKSEAERARAEYEAREYGLQHLTEFQKQPDQQHWIEQEAQTKLLRDKVYQEQLATDHAHAEIYDAFEEYRTALQKRLGYGDFLYFSVGAATTATFGDISPNSTTVRLLVCLQVFCSILLTGLLVSDLAREPK